MKIKFNLNTSKGILLRARIFYPLFLILISSLIISLLSVETIKLNNQLKTLQTQAGDQFKFINDFHQANLNYLKTASLSALRKNQGVNVATVEATLQETKKEILNSNFASASATLATLNNNLNSLLNEKIDKDRIASAAAKKKAEEAAAAKQKAAQAALIQTQTQAPTITNPDSLGNGFSRPTVVTKNGTFIISLIKVNLSGRGVITDSANDNDCANACPTKPLADYVSANGATYGMNGTYFCPPDYSSCAGKTSSYDFPLFNTRLGKWLNQANLYWTNRAMMTFNPGSATFYPNSSAAPTGGFGAAIVSSPGLVHNGSEIVGQYQLTSAQTTKGARGGLGIKGSTLFMVIASGASVPDLAAIFLTLGVDSALNIDGGGSSAMWAGGYRVGPGRSLPNAVLVK